MGDNNKKVFGPEPTPEERQAVDEFVAATNYMLNNDLLQTREADDFGQQVPTFFMG